VAHFAPPGGGEIVAFVAGALAAFLLVGAVARADLAHPPARVVSAQQGAAHRGQRPRRVKAQRKQGPGRRITFNHMVDPSALDGVYGALADASRRTIVWRLAVEGELMISIPWNGPD
jgi:hypothetical protein